jgi:acyl-CoA dehydrogenase
MLNRIDNWLAQLPHLPTNPLVSMRQAGLLDPAPDYATIARAKALLVERTGLLGIAGIWGGSQLIGRHFLSFGTDAQRAEWQARPLAVAISEPKVGAHPKLLATPADQTETGFRITGQKAWVSNAEPAEAIIVFAITAQEASRKRYSAFIVPRQTAGLTMSEMPGFHALRPSRHYLLTLDQCLLPHQATLGEPGSAYETMAMPFRDIEDAVGTFSTLGALHYALRLFPTAMLAANSPTATPAAKDPEGAPAAKDPAATPAANIADLGAIVALTAVFEAAATKVVATLDEGILSSGDATLVGLRVLAIDMVERMRTLASAAEGATLTELIGDLDATLAIAQAPRLARQVKLAEALLPPSPAPVAQ